MLPSIIRLSPKSSRSTRLLTSSVNYGTRWIGRRPVAVVNKRELFDDIDLDDTIETKRGNALEYARRRRPKVCEKKEKMKEKRKENEIETNIAEPKYIALDADDELISSLMIDVKTRKKRERNGRMLLEGSRLIQDAIRAGIMPKVIFFNRLSDVLPLSLPKETKLYKIPYRTIQLWSNLTTSPGIIGIFEIPSTDAKEPAEDAIPLTIICDNIREPGNLATIVRASAAVGCEKLLLMKGCVDLWEPKVLRGATGAHFRLPIFTSVLWDEIPTLIDDESAIFLTDNNVAYDDDDDDDDTKDCTVDADCTGSFQVNCDNNYAKQNNLDRTDCVKDDDATMNQPMSRTKTYKSTAKTRSLVKKLISRLPVKPYYALDFTEKETVLVIGGETEGVSLESCKLLRARNCTRVNIPLTNGVDSLNVGVAVGIVTFEMKRQFVTRKIDDE